MKTCYVSIPFGIKGGIDFDRIYRDLIMPAVLEAGLVCQRGDEFEAVALIQKSILQAVIASDVMIADVSNHSPNVMYELGIRHALCRGVTILLSSFRLPPPFHISHSYVLSYSVEADGTVSPESAAEARKMLTAVLQERTGRMERVTNDSPIFEYFPSIRVELPEGLHPPGWRRYAYPTAAQPKSPAQLDRKSDIASAEEETRRMENVDPQAYVDILKRYANLSAWEDVIRTASSLPQEVAVSWEAVQMAALAYIQLGQLEKAVEVLQGYVEHTGGDPESYGLLGSIYKKFYIVTKKREYLKLAITHYWNGFRKDQQNLYLGRNLAFLLQHDGSREALSVLEGILPHLLQLVGEKLASSPLRDYRDVESALLLSVVACDWQGARHLVDTVLEMKPEAWTLEATRDGLGGMADVLPTEKDREELRALLNAVSLATEKEEDGEPYA